MMNEEEFHYFDIPKHEQDSAIGFLLESLIQARQSAAGLHSNQRTFDEDVNIYLAHLLFVNALPDYQTMTRRYLTLKASELMEMIGQTDDHVLHYFIYKVNADYLLLHLGIFRDLHPDTHHLFLTTEKQFSEMARSYYDQASASNHKIYRKQTAVGDVLDKLSHYFGDYKKILELVRRDFFHFVNWSKQKHVRIVEPEGESVPAGLLLEEKQNNFLDVYGEWLKTKSEDLLPRLIQLTSEIRKLDPDFQFDAQSLLPKI